MSGVGLGNMPANYRSDGSFDPSDQRTVESILFALETFHGEVSTFDLATHLDLPMNFIEPVLERMRRANLVKYEVHPRSTLVWRRTKAGIELAATVAHRLAARRR